MGRPLHAMFSTFVRESHSARAGESRGGVVLVLEEEIDGAVGIDKLLAPLLGGHVRNGLAGCIGGGVGGRVGGGGGGGGLTKSHADGAEGDAGLVHEFAGFAHQGGIVGNVLRGGGGRGGLGLAQGHADGAEGEAHLLEELVRLAHEAGLSAGAAVLVAGGARRDGGRARADEATHLVSLVRGSRETRRGRRRRRRDAADAGSRRRGGGRRSPPRRNTRLPRAREWWARACSFLLAVEACGRARRYLDTLRDFPGSPIHHDAAESSRI